MSKRASAVGESMSKLMAKSDKASPDKSFEEGGDAGAEAAAAADDGAEKKASVASSMTEGARKAFGDAGTRISGLMASIKPRRSPRRRRRRAAPAPTRRSSLRRRGRRALRARAGRRGGAERGAGGVVVEPFGGGDAGRDVVVLGGAGMSTSAGIPDFRSPGTGLYDNLQKYDLPHPQAIFSIDYFRERPGAFYELCRELWPGTYAPTATHLFIKLLHDKGRLLRCFTQNIDSLETAAGLPPDRVVAAHGNFDGATCIDTGAPVAVSEVKAAVDGPPGWAARDRHGGLVKPDIVFFGEGLPRRFFELANRDLPRCRLLLVIGTSLSVQPFASLGHAGDDCVRLAAELGWADDLADLEADAEADFARRKRRAEGDLGPPPRRPAGRPAAAAPTPRAGSRGHDAAAGRAPPRGPRRATRRSSTATRGPRRSRAALAAAGALLADDGEGPATASRRRRDAMVD
ncbi:NAD+ binding protein [Aureococcus anophagefferens]|nr:NAD+ binding protein [Aureococcus anophagefferens]